MNFSAKTRTWLYVILLAAQPLAVAYGVVNDTTATLWVNLGAAILSGGLALSNITPDEPKDGKHEA
jgi:hypothetical protein